MENPSRVETFQIDSALSDALRAQYLRGQEQRFDKTHNGEHISFGIVQLPLDDTLGQQIGGELARRLDVEIVQLRLHQWQPQDEAPRHVDNIHPGCGTIILRLDGDGPSRLKIDDELVPEGKGQGYWLVEGVPHQIMSGSGIRYTLTGWARARASAHSDAAVAVESGSGMGVAPSAS